jgi:hypothetical protein
MKNAVEVLQQKETDLARVRKEVDSLRLALPLLSESTDGIEKAQPQSASKNPLSERRSGSEATGTDGVLPSASPSRSKIWNALTRRS